MMKFDNTQAISEGWDLFDVDGRLQLQRIDEQMVFGSDVLAIISVANKASLGSEYHYNALSLIGSLSENVA